MTQEATMVGRSSVAFRTPPRGCGFGEAVRGLTMGGPERLPRERDLRAGRDWWNPCHDEGAALGTAALATALRWHLVEAGRLRTDEPLAPRFLAMASDLTGESGHARRRVRAVLEGARRFGCVRQADLAELAPAEERLLFARAARYRMTGYISLGADDLTAWRRWLATFGPIVTWLHVDAAWAHPRDGRLTTYDAESANEARAVAVVGYHTDGSFIVRESRGDAWGEAGHAYVSEAYARAAFMEGYGLAV
jgi:hypothetical protein